MDFKHGFYPLRHLGKTDTNPESLKMVFSSVRVGFPVFGSVSEMAAGSVSLLPS